MSQPARNGSPAGHDGTQTHADWLSSLTNSILDMQRLQWATLNAWQQSMLAFHRDLWEQWACRFGGGVPIDA